MLRAWQDYANALASVPDGSVLIAEHGAAVQRITTGRLVQIVDFTKARISGYNSPGVTPSGAFESEGIAVAANGAAFLDTAIGDG